MSRTKNSHYERVSGDILERFLEDLAKYIRRYGYTSWENKRPDRPFVRNRYLFVPVKIANKIAKKYGVSSNKVAYGLREWIDSPYIAHTIVGFYERDINRRRGVSMWVFNMEDLMIYLDNKEKKTNKNST